MITAECITRTVFHVVSIVAKVHIVRDGFRSRRPGHVHPCVRMVSAVRRIGRGGIRPRLARSFDSAQKLGVCQRLRVEPHIAQVATPHLRSIRGIATHAKRIRIDRLRRIDARNCLTIPIVCYSASILHGSMMHPDTVGDWCSKGNTIYIGGIVIVVLKLGRCELDELSGSRRRCASVAIAYNNFIHAGSIAFLLGPECPRKIVGKGHSRND